MKLPLLLHATPRITDGPTVMLTKGKWRFESNHIDSEIRVTLNSNLIPLRPAFPLELDLEDDVHCKLQIAQKGTEKEITVYAIQL